ncbi:hypothetical protein DFQ26_000357, partial [Actinomortierella ambigua]
MIGYDAEGTLTFNFIHSADCFNNASASSGDLNQGEEDKVLFWRHAQWVSLPYPGRSSGGGHGHPGHEFDTEHCFINSDNEFVVPFVQRHPQPHDQRRQVGFSFWNHDERTWSHTLVDDECSCHEHVEQDGVEIWKDNTEHRRLWIDHAVSQEDHRKVTIRVALVYRGADHDRKVDTVALQWYDHHGRSHITGIQFVGRQVSSCHDTKLRLGFLPDKIDLLTSAGPTHHRKHEDSHHHHDQHGRACTDGDTESIDLMFLGGKGSGWLKAVASTCAHDKTVHALEVVRSRIETHHDHKTHYYPKLYPLPAVKLHSPKAVHHHGQPYILGKNDQGVGVWSIDRTYSRKHQQNPGHNDNDDDKKYVITARSQGNSMPGDITCASCDDGHRRGHGSASGILIYGGCDTKDQCSVNLKPGEHGKLEGEAPIAVYSPSSEDESESENNNNGNGKGSKEGGKHDHQEHDSDGRHDGSGTSGSGSESDSSSDSGHGHGHGSGSGSGSGSGFGSGTGSGSSGPGSSESGGRAEGSSGSGSWTPKSGYPSGTVPGGIPGANTLRGDLSSGSGSGSGSSSGSGSGSSSGSGSGNGSGSGSGTGTGTGTGSGTGTGTGTGSGTGTGTGSGTGTGTGTGP